MLKNSNSQIATIITFIVAVLFLFTLISINIGRIAQKKTNIDNIADSVGLSLASQLGSIGNALKHAMEIWGGSAWNCDWNWKLILGGIFVVAGIVGAIFGQGWVAALGFSLLMSGALLTTQGATMQYMAANPSAVEEIKIKFSALSDLQKIIESPIQGVMLSLADDPAYTADVFDMDRDGDTTDDIPRAIKWYNLRLNHFLNTLGMDTTINSFINDLFQKLAPQRRFIINEDPDTLTVRKGVDSVRWQIDADGDGTRELQVVPWIRDTLSNLLKTIRDYGYGINVRVTGDDINEINDTATYKYEGDATYTVTPTADGVNEYDFNQLGALGNLIGEIEEFENTIPRGLWDIDYESAVSSVGSWLGILYNSAHEDWYTRLGNLRTRVSDLRTKLAQRRGQIHNCVLNCGRNELACLNTALCKSIGFECDWFCWPPGCAGDPSVCWDGGCIPIKWQGCCGTWRNCGQLCGDAACPPAYACTLPLSGTTTNCCNVTPLESVSGCRSAPYSNIITTSNVLTILNSFINDIDSLRTLITGFYNRVKAIERLSYAQMREAFYLWSDFVGGVTSTKEKLNHVIFVRVACLKDPGTGFIMPHIRQKSSWKWGFIPQICIGVDNADGDFWLTVARFDESPIHSAPLLTRFRNFLFSKLGYSAGERTLLDNETTMLQNNLTANRYVDVINKTGLRNLLNSRGIVTRVNFNYGPGRTEEDQTTVSAADENRQIYIRGTYSSIDSRY